MNILFLYRIFPQYGGVEVVTTVLSNRFTADGHRVVIASFEQPHMELAKKLSPGIDLIKLDYPVFTKENVCKLHKELIDRKIDIIINQWGLPFKTTKLCYAAKKGTNSQLVSVLHGSPYTSKVILQAQDKVKNAKNPLSRGLYWAILKAKEEVIKYSIRYNVAHNSRYILLSEGFKQPLIDYTKVKDSSNIIAIGNPITVPVILDDFSWEKKKKQILYTGRMDYENKRVNRIIDAWDTIARDYPDWELVLIGDGPHKAELLNKINNNNIPRVHTEGFQEEAPISFFKDASIYMPISDLEGFGLVIIESMSYGVVPIVYGSYEAVYDIIENGKSGFITPMPYSNERTVEKLRFLIENEDERIKMGKNAMERAKLFSVDSVVKQWYSLINEVIR